MSTWVEGGLIVLVSTACAVAGLLLVRRFAKTELLREHHDVSAAMYALIGTIYAVLLAFAVVIVWQAFTETQSTVAQEANALGDLERMSRGYPIVIRREVHEAAQTYAHVVITREWPLMAKGTSSELANAELIDLWHIYTDLPPAQRAGALYASSLTALNTVTDERRLRLLASESRVQPIMWALLVVGGVVMVLFSYLFAVRSVWQQTAMTVMLSGMISFALFLIFALNGPFVGSVKVQPTAFETTLQNMEHVGG